MGSSRDHEPSAGFALEPEPGPSMPLAAWLDEVARLAGRESGAALVLETGVCCWMDFYSDGYAPAEAWAEECSDG